MFRIAKKVLRTFEQARYLTRVANDCKDHEELSRIALAILREQPAGNAQHLALESQDGVPRQLAA